jgi:virulence factor Mce-like protein
MRSKTLQKSIGLLIFFGLAALAAILLLDRVGTTIIPKDRFTLQADVTDAVALAGAADVRQSGVKIGRVTDIREHGRLIQLKLELDPKFTPIYKDATTLVRAKSIAEENYIELNPGTPSAGEIEEFGRIPVSQNLESTQNDDVFSIFDKLRRTSVQRALGGFAPGVEDEGGRDLNRTIESMTALVDDATPFARILAEERSHLARVVDSFGTVTAALGEREAAIRSLTTSGRVAAEAVAARDEELKATLDSLPPFLTQTRLTATNLGGFATEATPVLADLRVAFENLVPVAEELGPASQAGRRALTSLQRFSRAGTPALRALPRFDQALSRFTPQYEVFLRNLNPLVDYLDDYSPDIASWFSLASGATAPKDTISNVARVLLPVSLSSLPGTLPPSLEALIKQFMGGLDTRGTNAFPRPGTAEDPVQQPADFQYPRLTIDPPYTKAR